MNSEALPAKINRPIVAVYENEHFLEGYLIIRVIYPNGYCEWDFISSDGNIDGEFVKSCLAATSYKKLLFNIERLNDNVLLHWMYLWI